MIRLCAPLFFTFFLSIIAYSNVDEDLWWHLKVGQLIYSSGKLPTFDPYSYTASSARWINHEWLSDVAIAIIYNTLGSRGLFWLRAILIICIGALLHRLAKPFGWIGLIIGCIVAAELGKGLGTRPQIVTYGSMIALILISNSLALVSRSNKRRVGWSMLPMGLLFLFFSLWVNLHGGWIAGVVFLIGLATYAIIFHAPKSEILVKISWAISALLGTLLNPYGTEVYKYLLDEFGRNHPITEWQPITVNLSEHLPFLLLTTLFIVLNFSLYKKNLHRLTLYSPSNAPLTIAAFFGVILAWQAQRHTPLAALLLFIPLASGLVALAEDFPKSFFSKHSILMLRISIVGFTTYKFISAVLLSFMHSGQLFYFKDEYPEEALKYSQRLMASGKIAVPLEWGGYVLALAGPDIKVSLDGRFATLYPESIVAGNFALYSGSLGWEDYIQKFKPDAILAQHSLPHLEKSNSWKLRYQDDIATVYTPQVPLKASALLNHSFQTQNLNAVDNLDEYNNMVIFAP